MMYRIYRSFMQGARPLVDVILSRRMKAGREDPARMGERRGIASQKRPDGPLVWCHAASVGEAMSLLSLVHRIVADYPGLNVLVTTGTVTSAAMMADRLPKGAIHQYIPVDRPAWVTRFLDHWQPDSVIWSESELWPNLLMAIKSRNIPAALVNANMSENSVKQWRRVPRFIQELLLTFGVCLAQHKVIAGYLSYLGAKNVVVTGNIKYAAVPLPADPKALGEFESATADRTVWLAASTHSGEDEKILRVHQALKAEIPDLLTVIVPRHPKRGGEIIQLCRENGFVACQRSGAMLPAQDTDIYIADTMGELGLFYRACPVTFMGGTLVPVGGHNIIEPAQLGSAVIHGPYMHAQKIMQRDFASAGATLAIDDEAGLIQAVKSLLSDPAKCRALAEKARVVVAEKSDVLDNMMTELEFLFAFYETGEAKAS